MQGGSVGDDCLWCLSNGIINDTTRSYTLTVGSQTITQKSLASIKSELKRLYEKLGEEDKLDALNGSDGDVRWINEYE